MAAPPAVLHRHTDSLFPQTLHRARVVLPLEFDVHYCLPVPYSCMGEQIAHDGRIIQDGICRTDESGDQVCGCKPKYPRHLALPADGLLFACAA